MFQTGIEYAFAKYHLEYISNFNSMGGHFQTYTNYKDITISVNTITIPAYFNLLAFKQKVFFGLGPNLDILPYSPASGYTDPSTGKFENRTNIARVASLGLAAKIDVFFKLGKGKIVLESRLKSSVISLLFNGNLLLNEYAAIMAGYVF